MDSMSRRSFLKSSTVFAAVATTQVQAADESAAGRLLAGVAVRDITPEPGAPLWGYSDREGPATGTLDPLFAKAIVFRAGGAATAVVVLDLGATPRQDVMGRIRTRVRNAGIGHVMIAATHTHHGPVMELENAPYMPPIERAIGDCIEEAAGKLQPVRIGLGRTEVDVAHNRRLISEDGRCRMLWRNEERRPTSPVDREMGIVRIDRLDGQPLAILVNFACHPVVMGPSNLEYSADYCGEMARIVKEQTGAECLFLQGGAGNINPYLDKTPIDEGGVASMRAVGRTCAEAVLKAVGGIETEVPEAPSVQCRQKTVVVGTRFDLENDDQRAVLDKIYGDTLGVYLKDVTADLAVPLAVLVLNDDLAFAFMPGEIFVQYQLELKQSSPLRNTFLCGYANGFYAYFPTIRDAAAGGYGGLMATYVGVGAGDKLAMEAAMEIGTMTNRLKQFYDLKDFVVLEAE